VVHREAARLNFFNGQKLRISSQLEGPSLADLGEVTATIMKEERHKESLPLLQEGKEHPVQHHRRPVAVLLFPFLAAGVFALGFAGEYGPSFLELFKAKKKSMVTGADVRSTKKACNSSTMAILAPIALIGRECYRCALFAFIAW
jgi:hypothetical protein